MYQKEEKELEILVHREKRMCCVQNLFLCSNLKPEWIEQYFISMTEVPRQMTVKTRTIVSPPHKLASKGEVGMEGKSIATDPGQGDCSW